ncbi:MAG: dihydropteroate synthase [Euryarchaeota archaeon]|nr:dihydropteroate synthase [Euryarchaeota archaeon]MBT4407732.1 dihydropteroate synthase [Euryarchaeota archaeon]
MPVLRPLSASRQQAVIEGLRQSDDYLPRIMGIVNVTPDSFHQQSRKTNHESAIEAGIAMWLAGATWVDVGGESTRPGADSVSIEEELERVIPVIIGLRSAKPDGLISIDTRNFEVAEAALAAGADLINDISGLRDAKMAQLVIRAKCGVCIMHMLGEPGNMQENPHYANVVEEVASELLAKAESLVAEGLNPELICLDPGIGFGKTLEHNLALLRNPNSLRGLESGCCGADNGTDTDTCSGDDSGNCSGNCEECECSSTEVESNDYSVLWGVSRKSMFKDLLGREDPSERLAGTLGVAAVAVHSGVDILRVHDVVEHLDFLATILELD